MRDRADWIQKTLHSWACGKYTISAAWCMGKLYYSAWPPKPVRPTLYQVYEWQDQLAVSIGCYDTPGEAREACAQHAEGQAA